MSLVVSSLVVVRWFFLQHKLYWLIVLEFFIGLSNMSFLGLIMSGVVFSISNKLFVTSLKLGKL